MATPTHAQIDAEASNEGIPKGQETPTILAAEALNLIAEKIADALAAGIMLAVPPALIDAVTRCAVALEAIQAQGGPAQVTVDAILKADNRMADAVEGGLALQKPAA
jgi:hypothetical protein